MDCSKAQDQSKSHVLTQILRAHADEVISDEQVARVLTSVYKRLWQKNTEEQRLRS